MKRCNNTTTTSGHVPCHLVNGHRLFSRCCSGLFDKNGCDVEASEEYKQFLKDKG